MVHVDNLTKSFHDSVLALDHISFEARPGEIFGLIGPNGAGKTTALRILSTVLRPTAGTATVAGFDVVTQAAQVRRHIGFQSATTGIYDRMTAWESVEYFGRLNGLEHPALTQRMEEVFAQLQMNDFRDVYGSRMSTGMKQKVSIARAVIHDPPVLIFDEPTAGLDVLVQRAVLQIIKQLRAQGRCILFSTHIMREVEKLCDRVAIIHHGRLLTCGTQEELRHQHGQDDLEELFFALVT
jgi:sodium transport system ATP-binding protein